MSATKDTVRSELALRLTDRQIETIQRRHRRREQHVKECGYLNLGNISEPTDSELSQACTQANG